MTTTNVHVPQPNAFNLRANILSHLKGGCKPNSSQAYLRSTVGAPWGVTTVRGQYDKLVSVGMFEHVGPKNYRNYFEAARRLMKDNGLFLLHTIGLRATSRTVDAWLDKYIFPNGKLPAAREITRAIDRLFLIEDWHWT